jgi:hypothetical protein
VAGQVPLPLDAGLAALDLGWYQGSELVDGETYARAAVELRDADPGRSAAYAGRAIGVLKLGLRAYQKSGANSLEMVGRGDGVKTRFPLHPNVRGPVRASAGKVQVLTVVRDTAYPSDRIGGPAHLLRAYDVDREYRRGVDWAPGDFPLDIDWLPGGQSPTGPYTVELVGPGWPPAEYPRDGDSLVLPTPPAADEYVFAAYVYDDADGPYQQTYDWLGGYRTAYCDDGYVSRYWHHLAVIVDLLWDDLSPALRTEATDLFVRWCDHKVYANDSRQSNYGVGAHRSRVSMALCLRKHSHPEGDRLVAEVVQFRAARLAQINGPAPSLRGGFWAEGWSYGDLAAQNLIAAGLELEAAGLIQADAERAFAAEVAVHLAHADPDGTRTTVFDGGDWFQWPAPYPADLAAYLGTVGTPALETVSADHYAEGTGLVLCRAGGLLVSVHAGYPLWADHQQFSPGQVQVWADGVPVVCNGPVRLHDQSGLPKSRWANTPVIDCPDRAVQNYERSMGGWYGTGHTFITAYEPGEDRTTVRLNIGPAWSHSTAPGAGGPVEFACRDVTVLKATGAVVVYDRVCLRGDWPWEIQWCVAPGAVVLTFGDVSGRVERTEQGVSFMSFPGVGRRGKVVTVLTAGRIPGVVLSPGGVTVDGQLVTLDPDWPPSLVAPPPVVDPVDPNDPTPPPPSRPMPDPILTLDAAHMGGSAVGVESVPAAFNGHAVLRFGSDSLIDLGTALAGVPSLAVVALYKKVPGGAYNFPLVSRAGQFDVISHQSAGGLIASWVTAGGTNSMSFNGDVTEFHVWAASFAPATEGMVAACDDAVGTGNPPFGGPLAPGSGPLVVNPAGGAFELVGLDLYAVGLTKAETALAVARLRDRYAAPPPPPVDPPTGRVKVAEFETVSADGRHVIVQTVYGVVKSPDVR